MLRSFCRETSGEWKIAALFGFHRIWRHKVNCPEGTREGPLGGVRKIRETPCAPGVSLHGSLAAPQTQGRYENLEKVAQATFSTAKTEHVLCSVFSG